MAAGRRSKLLLVQPKGGWSFLGQVSRHGKAGGPRLSLPIIAGLTPGDFDIEIVDCLIQELDEDGRVSSPEARPDLVGISVLTNEAPEGYRIADHFRKHGVPVVLGGYHPTFMPDEALKHADSVVLGEAELVWAELIEDFRHGKLRNRYQADHHCDLDKDVPPPRRDLLDKDRYSTFNVVQATRGCMHSCDYCSVSSFFNSSFRKRDLGRVAEEIKELLQHSRSYTFWERLAKRDREVFFADDNLMADRQYAKDLCRAIKSLDITWSCQASVEIGEDEDLLAAASESGCRWVLVGFESLQASNLRALNKAWALPEHGSASPGTLDAYYQDFINKAHKYGINVYGNFMFGFPHDDEEVLLRTTEFAVASGLDAAMFHVLTPFPGTPRRKKLLDQRRIFADGEKWWQWYNCSEVLFAPDSIMVPDLQRLLWNAYKTFYSRRHVVRLLLNKTPGKLSRLFNVLRTRSKLRSAQRPGGPEHSVGGAPEQPVEEPRARALPGGGQGNA